MTNSFLHFTGSLLCLAIVYGLSAFWLYFLVVNAPKLEGEQTKLELSFPKTLEELKQYADILLVHAEDHPGYVITLFVSAYLFKQTFAIPGSFFLNLLGGALYGTMVALPLCSLLTACGATLCYIISRFVGAPLAVMLLNKSSRLEQLKRKVANASGGNLVFLLISFRLFPFTPNWFLNIASPHLAIPVDKFFASVLLGLMPYNLICVQTGSTLSSINSIGDISIFKRLLPLAGCVWLVWCIRQLVKRKQAAQGRPEIDVSEQTVAKKVD